MAIKSRKLNAADAALIRALLNSGWLQSDIASLFQCNGGRIAEIHTGQKWPALAPADLTTLEARARLAEVQAAWALRIARQLSHTFRFGVAP